MPAVTGNRQALLNLPLEAYQEISRSSRTGFCTGGKVPAYLAHLQNFRSAVPVPGRTVGGDPRHVGDAWNHAVNRAKLVQWYWNGFLANCMVRQ